MQSSGRDATEPHNPKQQTNQTTPHPQAAEKPTQTQLAKQPQNPKPRNVRLQTAMSAGTDILNRDLLPGLGLGLIGFSDAC